MLPFPGNRVNKSADIPFMNLAMLFSDSYVNVFTDLLILSTRSKILHAVCTEGLRKR